MNTLQLDRVYAAPWGSPLLENISFALEPGTVLGLTGPNGAGKSSLLNLIAGDIKPDSGTLSLAGRQFGEWSPRERAQRLAFLPQLSLLNFPYTVEEVVMLGRIPHDSGHAADVGIVDKALRESDMSALRTRLYTQLSGGEKQRTQLARIFAQISGEDSLSGKLLMLDEPTSALDLAHQQQILQSVRQLARRGCAVVIALHDFNLLAAVADRILVLDNGHQHAIGTPEQVLTEVLFRDVFAVEVMISRHPRDDYPLVTPVRREVR